MRRYKKVSKGQTIKAGWLVIGLYLMATLVLLSACGYPTPVNGGGLTPFVIVVTPTGQAGPSPSPAPTTPAVILTPTPSARAAETTRSGAVSPAARPSPTLAITADGKYIVQSGDTLYGISIRLAVDLDDLIDLNQLTEPDKLKVGQLLKIPPKKAEPAPTKKP